MKFIRVETFSRNRNAILGGYIGAAYAILYAKLCMKPTDSEWELADRLSKTDDSSVLSLWSTIIELSRMKQPEIYVNDKENHICLYTESKFMEDVPLLSDLDEHLNEVTDGKLRLVYANYDIEDYEILYDDEEQIVISRETYEKHKEDREYNPIEKAA